MYNQQFTQLDPALQALITLNQRANPTTPNGQPTIARQVMGQAMQPQGQPQMQPQGQPQEQQGLPGVLANLNTANPSMQQNAQQGQVDQMAQQVSQRMQQQQQPPGLSGLPAGNMGFKEGGIVPYAAGGEIDLSGLYGRDMLPQAGIAGALPVEDRNREIEAIRAKQAQLEALSKNRPDYYAQNIAALEADKQARAEAAATQQKREGFEALMTALGGGARGGMAGFGEGVMQFNKEVAGRQNAGREANLLNAQMRIKLGEAEDARQRGDISGAMNIEKEIAGLKRQMENTAVNRDQVAAMLKGQEATAATAAARLAQDATEGGKDRASRERIAAMGGGGGDSTNRALFMQEIKNSKVDDDFERAGRLRAYDPAGAKKLEDAATLRYNTIAAKYGYDKKDAVPVAPAAPKLVYNPKTGKVE